MILPLFIIFSTVPAGKAPVSKAAEAVLVEPTMTPAFTVNVTVFAVVGDPAEVKIL
jgi:hypothetical protein